MNSDYYIPEAIEQKLFSKIDRQVSIIPVGQNKLQQSRISEIDGTTYTILDSKENSNTNCNQKTINQFQDTAFTENQQFKFYSQKSKFNNTMYDEDLYISNIKYRQQTYVDSLQQTQGFDQKSMQSLNDSLYFEEHLCTHEQGSKPMDSYIQDMQRDATSRRKNNTSSDSRIQFLPTQEQCQTAITKTLSNKIHLRKQTVTEVSNRKSQYKESQQNQKIIFQKIQA